MSAKPIAEMSFEEAMAELEAIVGKLESAAAPLEESLGLYERGEALRRHCDDRLKAAELRVRKIVAGADGAAKGAEPFDAE